MAKSGKGGWSAYSGSRKTRDVMWRTMKSAGPPPTVNREYYKASADEKPPGASSGGSGSTPAPK